MSFYIGGSLVGMADAVKNEEYQQKLTEQTVEILGDKTTISVDDLKKNAIFSKAFKNLSKTGKENLNKLFNLDGDAQNVSEKELKTILTLLDADLQTYDDRRYSKAEGKYVDTKEEAFFMDNEIGTKKTSGIYQATDDEIQNVYQNTKTRAEVQAEEVEKQKRAAQELEDLNKMVAEYDVSNSSDLTKALNTLRQNARIGDSDGYQIFEMAVQNLFKGELKQTDHYRDGGSALYKLKDGTEIYHNNAFISNENGYVTITRTDGTVEKYDRQGNLVK